jgi:hypothetical protein
MNERSSIPAMLAIVLFAFAWAGSAQGQPEGPAPPPADSAAGEPDEPGAFAACARRAKRAEIMLDTASRRLHQTVCGAALWFDGLFGEGDLDAALESYGHVEVSTAYSEFSGSHTRFRFHARVKLPAMEHRLSAFVGIDDEEDFVRDRAEGQALRSRQRVTDRDTFLVGLGFAGYTSDRFQSDLKVGVRDVRLPKVFLQNRFNYIPYSGEKTRLILRVTPFWDNRDLFGTTTHTSFDKILGEAYLLRWSTAATVSEEVSGVDWRTALILYQNLNGSDALAYEAFIRGGSGAPESLREFGLRTVYRLPMWRDRLIGQLVVGYSWPRDDPALEREGAADIGVGVELPFGEEPK